MTMVPDRRLDGVDATYRVASFSGESRLSGALQSFIYVFAFLLCMYLSNFLNRKIAQAVSVQHARSDVKSSELTRLLSDLLFLV